MAKNIRVFAIGTLFACILPAMAAATDVDIPVKLEIPDLKPGEKVDWSQATIRAGLLKKDGGLIALNDAAWKENAAILTGSADKLGDDEVTLIINVFTLDLDRFPYRARFEKPFSKKILADKKGAPFIVPLKRIHFYKLSARVVNAQGKPVAGEPVSLYSSEGGASIARKKSDKDGLVVFSYLEADRKFVLRSGHGLDSLEGAEFARVTIKPEEFPKLKEPIVLRLPALVMVADVVVQDGDGKTTPLPDKFNSSVELRVPGKLWVVSLRNGKLYVFEDVPPGEYRVGFQPGDLEKSYKIVSGSPLAVPKPGEKPESARIVLKKR